MLGLDHGAGTTTFDGLPLQSASPTTPVGLTAAAAARFLRRDA